MRIVVTGGTGFIGSRLVSSLCRLGHEVRVISRKTELDVPGDCFDVVNLDLVRATSVPDELLADCSLFFNCAGALSDNSCMRALHVESTRMLVDACKKAAVASSRSIHWVQLSSVGAYGAVRGRADLNRVVTEETLTNPKGEYEVTKTQADELLLSAAEPGVFSCSILRPSNVYGIGMPNDSLRQWGRVLQANKFFYIGPNGAISTYVHVDDVVRALLLCGFNEHAKGEIFNISNDCTQEELVEAMAEALKVRAPALRVPELLARATSRIFSRVPGFPLSSTRIDSLVARTTYPVDKLATVLGYSHDRPVKDTISEVILSNNDGR
ncbi:NAD(P)-dependent oxidoreductase [Stutzerimonas stutzeri]|uniref:NAD(P)-dependent oxidoreductase n=1 Tax=Stutzerimonas stutzeri TaxID=316 RepID=A0A2S4AK37_STUST|nr:NAD(P)-dependent oxidoreductase [Stutzerimonas stutzeri]MCQ4263736.1 NAD(P)-dependent oxidoreductase [Stutzerimonas stutzeri]POH81592.1 NAD(P)-dependent oxidoreductase [Stutzerimonas stutzeri]